MNDETVLKYQDVVRKAAVHISIEWPDVDVTDVEQDIWIRLLESPGTVETLGTFADDAVLRFMYKLAKQVAVKDKQKARVAAGDFRYSTGEVKRMLDGGILTALGAGEFGSWTADEEQSATGKGYSDKTGATASAMLDMDMGLKELRGKNERHFNLLIAKFVLWEVLSLADLSAANRAVKSLTDKMNYNHQRLSSYHHEGPGSRKAVSNQSMHYKSHGDYDGNGGWKPLLGGGIYS
jgi:hypothetical protein